MANVDRAGGQRRVEHRPMLPDDGPIRGRRQDHQDAPECAPLPASIAGHDRGDDTDLPRHRHQQRLEVRDRSLYLHEEQRATIRLPRKDVDRAAIPELVERELELDRPTCLGEGNRDPFDDRSMALIEKPIDCAATPTRFHDQLDPEARTQAACRAQGDVLEPSGLEVGEHGPMDPDRRGDVLLA